MFLRISSLAMLTLLSGCGSNSTVSQQVADAPANDRVECAIGAAPLTKDCAIERNSGTITVRHADGSFRRFEVDAKGQFGAADGAEEIAGQRSPDGSVAVSIGDRRYRFASTQLTP
jgi:hypothetical protein